MSYLDSLAALLSTVQVTDRAGGALSWDQGAMLAAKYLKLADTIYFIGNGGSAAIASHAATDYTKNGKLRATTFNDPSLITCLSNDFSYSEMFGRAVTRFVDHHDCVVCISSSGRSQNILLAAANALQKGAAVLTFTGFTPDNPLRTMGRLNIYVPSAAYGHVETAHLGLLHAILEEHIMERRGQ